MDKVLRTIPASSLRNSQAEILLSLDESPVVLTHRGRAAGVLLHPARYNEIIELLEDYEEGLLAQQRSREMKADRSVVMSLDEVKAQLVADGLLDE